MLTNVKIIVVANEKGGVGKTTTALHLAFAAAQQNHRVLFVDLDTQGTASQMLLQNPSISLEPGGSVNLFIKPKLLEVKATSVEKIVLLHGSRELERVDAEANIASASELRSTLSAYAREIQADIVVIDTPPAFCIRHVAPLFWADRIVVPMEASLLSIGGLSTFLKTLQNVRKQNRNYKMDIFVNRYIQRSGSQQVAFEVLKTKFDMKLNAMANRVAVGDALAATVPVWNFTNDKMLAQQWKSLSETLLKD